ncbi:MAG: TonB-dependent receptor [Pyrinomonadaceae bacterium MAG19_C2-C3]|nr:TonB-dependent receptor [Pyrinomonadaceae bacterium MAG19_C2-C3]
MHIHIHPDGGRASALVSRLLFILIFVTATSAIAFAQNTATVRGTVTFQANGESVSGATVILSPTGRITQTDENGAYEFTGIPAGRYEVIARLTRFPDTVSRVDLTGGGEATADLSLRLTGVREEVTVTASSANESTVNAIRPTEVVDAIELTERAHPSLGEVLEYQPGIAKRSFGPGTARPVIRGFDGDRVLVLTDSLPISSVGSQSGDHGEPVDVLALERVELVRGPGTLLYGSNAIGGVVNAITSAGSETAPAARQARGYLTFLGGSANRQRGGSAGFDLGLGGNFHLFANGGGQRTSDYETPIGRIQNSSVRSYNGTAGLGYSGERGFFRASGTYDNRLYGVPFAGLFEGEEEEEAEATALRASQPRIGRLGEGDDPIDVAQIALQMRRQNLRFSGGFRNLDSFISGINLFVDYTDYRHQELEGSEVGTTFNNDQFNYRTVFEQNRRGRLTGRFGVSGFSRDFEALGAEALAPPTTQNNFAVFALEELNFERTVLQFGGRVETNRYRPEQLLERQVFDRNFTGFSGSVGVRFGLFDNASLVGNFTHSYRAPALEELYNFGPHIGTLTFEIGDSNLTRERSNGADFGFRYGTQRVRLEANAFYYDFDNFVFLAPTGNIEDGLPEANYAQDDARFYGSEIGLNFGLVPNRLNVNSSFDFVNARIKDGTPLPRIPPVRGRFGVEFLAGGFRIEPEAIFASDQDDLFPTETRTAGYTIFNLRGSYTIPQDRFAHVFTVNAFNLGDRLYRNHVSFIKDLAPEIGRGVRVVYTMRFF